jgi:general L-amino acid transport system permease protein
VADPIALPRTVLARRLWAAPRLRAAVLQGVGLGITAALLWGIAHNTVGTLHRHGISLGFGFLRQPANFAIGDTWLPYSPADSFGRAILVGLANTAKVSLFGCLLAIALGFVLGVLRLSSNPALRGIVRAVVEVIRNTPLLLLLLFFAATMHALPSARRALEPAPGLFISDRGMVLPYPALTSLHLWLGALVVLTLVGRRHLGRWGWPAVAAALVVFGAAVAFAPPAWNVPRLEGFNFVGGATLSPEFAALLIALVLHHAAHISEVVRGAILAVPRGQRDAALALGLSRMQAMRLVIVPQALRAMVPLLATNCVSLIKNSSLAVAIGFPDVVSILNTTSNQTGHSIETMLIMIGVYLTLSLAVAAALNGYNARLLRRGGAARA